jgi:dodecin
VRLIVELMGTSDKSWDDAVLQIVAEASASLRQTKRVDGVKQTAHVEDGRIAEYRMTAHLAFVVEEHRPSAG